MEWTLFDKNGDPVAYVADDYHETIYLWDGSPVAYLYEDRQLYGVNGRHLGWFIDDIIYTHRGERIGFTSGSCPVPIAKEPAKEKKYPRDEIMPRWEAQPPPKLEFAFAEQDFAEFLREGQVVHSREEGSSDHHPSPASTG